MEGEANQAEFEAEVIFVPADDFNTLAGLIVAASHAAEAIDKCLTARAREAAIAVADLAIVGVQMYFDVLDLRYGDPDDDEEDDEQEEPADLPPDAPEPEPIAAEASPELQPA